MTSLMTTSAPDSILIQSSPSTNDDSSIANASDLASSSNTSEPSPATSDENGGQFFLAVGMCVGAWGVGIFIIGGNLLIVCAVLQVQKLHNLSNVYIASLAVADCLVGIVLLPLGISYLPNFAYLFQDSYGGCMTFICLIYAVVCCSGGHMLLVSVDRYLFLIHPFIYARAITERKVVISIVVVWLLSFLYGCGVFVFNDCYSVRNCNGPEILSDFYTVHVSGALHFVLTLITSYVYYRIMMLAIQKWSSSRNRRSKHRKGHGKFQRKVGGHHNDGNFQNTSIAESSINKPTLVTEAPNPVDNVEEVSPTADSEGNTLTDHVTEVRPVNSADAHYAASPGLHSAAKNATLHGVSSLPNGSATNAVPGPLKITVSPFPSSTENVPDQSNQPKDATGGSDFKSGDVEHPKTEMSTLYNGRTEEKNYIGNASEHLQTSNDPNGDGNDPGLKPWQGSVSMSPRLESTPGQSTAGFADPTEYDPRALPRGRIPSECSTATTSITDTGPHTRESLFVAKDPLCSVSRRNTVITTHGIDVNVPVILALNSPLQAEWSTAYTEGAAASKLPHIAETPPPPPPPPPTPGYMHGESGSSPWKAIKLFVSVFICFTAFWLPYYICMFVRTLYNLQQSVLDLFVLLGLLNSGVNFIVCAMISRDFRAYFRRRLCPSSWSGTICSTLGMGFHGLRGA
ncbi:hypothetical protein ACOMHN_031841 [Nucella lapillus]